MTADEIATETARLERLKAARKGIPGYASNVKAIEARLEELRAMEPETPE